MEQKFSSFKVRTDVSTDEKGKRHLYVGISDLDDPYAGILKMLGIRLDNYTRPNKLQCGMLGKPGDDLPKWLELIPEEN